MRIYNYSTAIVMVMLCFWSNSIFSQRTFSSREELNQYIFQNSDLENITDGYLLDFNHDITPALRDSFFLGIENTVQLDQILSYFKLMEDSDVSDEFEMDSVLFPVMDRIYANNGISPVAIPLFICDVRFNHLNTATYQEFLN